MVGRFCTEAAQRKRAEPRGTWEEEEEEEEEEQPSSRRGRKRDSRRWRSEWRGRIGGVGRMQGWGLEWQKEKCGEWRGSRGRGGSRAEAANEPRMGIGTREWEKGESV